MKLTSRQRSNVTLTLKLSAFFRSLELALTVPPRQKLNKSWSPTLILAALFTLSHVRPALTCAMPPATESSR